MMMEINLVGRAAFTRNHQWILLENYKREAHTPKKSTGGVLLPRSGVKFERYLMGEVICVGTEAGEVNTRKKVLFSNINAYEVDIKVAPGSHAEEAAGKEKQSLKFLQCLCRIPFLYLL